MQLATVYEVLGGQALYAFSFTFQCSQVAQSQVMPVRLKNATLNCAQCAALQERLLAQQAVEREAKARAEAKGALARWYTQGFDNANRLLPQIQIEANLQVVAAIPNWRDLKSERDAYIMLKGEEAGTARPVILHLNYSSLRFGNLTYRELHKELRCHLQLPKKVSLRVCPDRPWYNYFTSGIPVPEHKALPANDSQCRHIFGTTLRFYSYTHITEPDEEPEPKVPIRQKVPALYEDDFIFQDYLTYEEGKWQQLTAAMVRRHRRTLLIFAVLGKPEAILVQTGPPPAGWARPPSPPTSTETRSEI